MMGGCWSRGEEELRRCEMEIAELLKHDMIG